MSGEHEQEGHGQIGDGGAEHAGRITERNAVAGQEGDVEGVEADGGRGHDFQVGCEIDDLLVDRDQGVAEHAVGVFDCFEECAAVAAVNDADVSGLGEHVVEFVFDRYGLDDGGHENRSCSGLVVSKMVGEDPLPFAAVP